MAEGISEGFRLAEAGRVAPGGGEQRALAPLQGWAGGTTGIVLVFDHGTGEASVPNGDDHHGRMTLAPTSSTPASVAVPALAFSPNRMNSMLLVPTGTVASVMANRVQVSD